MIDNQMRLKLSPHMTLYDLLIPADHLLRKIVDLVDFSFVYNELKDKYSETNGRNAVHPIILFKYILLKYIYGLSDRGVVNRSLYDMSFKYFLDLQPEDPVIDASLLTKFRTQRLKDIEILDMLINKSVELAILEGVINTRTSIIIDATHTNSKYHQMRKGEMFAGQIKKIETFIDEMKLACVLPEKPDGYKHKTSPTHNYGRKVVEKLKESGVYKIPALQEDIDLLEEMLDDHEDTYEYSIDKEARVGHKTETKTFYGYKTHLAMTQERIITAATITSGEKADGKELRTLVEKTQKTGLNVEEVVADKAYPSIDNAVYLKEEGIKMIIPAYSRLEVGKEHELKGFIFNKDAGMMQCRQGELAKRCYSAKRSDIHKNDAVVYIFDIEKCKTCPKREGCYKEGQKTKECKVTIQKEFYKEQEEFRESEYFKERYKERYKIEAKNGELKCLHGYGTSEMTGLRGMNLQGAITLFAVNIKRIIKLQGESLPQNEKEVKEREKMDKKEA